MGKGGGGALLSLSSWCLVIVVWLFLAVPWVCLQFVIMVFSDISHLLFWTAKYFCFPLLTSKHCHTKSKLECKDQESIQSSNTPDSGYQWESDKLTMRNHKLEPRGQPFPSR